MFFKYKYTFVIYEIKLQNLKKVFKYERLLKTEKKTVVEMLFVYVLNMCVKLDSSTISIQYNQLSNNLFQYSWLHISGLALKRLTRSIYEATKHKEYCKHILTSLH